MAHILIVEDNRDIAALYQRALFKHQHTHVNTAEKALDKLKGQTFDLIILDLHLAEMSGLSLLEYIRSQPNGDKIKVFVVSADDLLKTRCEALGIQAWMTKPIEIDVFIDTVDHWVGEPAAQK
jgi:CheY-like chemotaxis protein